LKMLVAYSTVAQIGFIFLLFPSLASGWTEAAPAWRTEAWTGGAIQAVAHALAKASLFLAAGIVILARGSDALTATRGLARKLPLTTLTLLLAGLALYGIPSSGSELGKKMILHASQDAGQWWWVPFIKLGSFLTLAYTLAMLRYSILPPHKDASFHFVPLWVQALPLALALSSIALAWPRETLLGLLAPGNHAAEVIAAERGATTAPLATKGGCE
jgi:multicomponent Na+:H+ antiporter subunit D